MVSCPILGGSEELIVQSISASQHANLLVEILKRKTDGVSQAGQAAEQPGGMKGRVHIQVVCIESKKSASLREIYGYRNLRWLEGSCYIQK